MIEESGLVIALDGPHAWVRTERRTACGACAARGGCGVSLLDSLLGRRPNAVRALNRAEAEVGDRVLVGIGGDDLLALALATYLAPTLALLAGILAGSALGGDQGDAAGLLGGALGLTLGLLWLRAHGARRARNPETQPVVLRRLGPSSTAYPVVELGL